MNKNYFPESISFLFCIRLVDGWFYIACLDLASPTFILILIKIYILPIYIILKWIKSKTVDTVNNSYKSLLYVSKVFLDTPVSL